MSSGTNGKDFVHDAALAVIVGWKDMQAVHRAWKGAFFSSIQRIPTVTGEAVYQTDESSLLGQADGCVSAECRRACGIDQRSAAGDSEIRW